MVGDAKTLYDKLKGIAPVRMVDIEGKPMDPGELNPTGGPVALDRSQIVARSDSFQALVQGNVFGGQTAKVVTDGDSIVYSESTVIGPFEQRSIVVLNSDLSMRRTDQTGLVQGQPRPRICAADSLPCVLGPSLIANFSRLRNRAERPSHFAGSHIVRAAKVINGGMAGSIPFNLVSWLGHDSRPMPASELLAWNGEETSTSGARGHLWSWMLYHWLWNQRSKAFADYQKRLAESGDPEAAWHGAFPEFDPKNPEALAKLGDRHSRAHGMKAAAE